MAKVKKTLRSVYLQPKAISQCLTRNSAFRSIEELAGAAHIDTDTVRRADSGQGIYIRTLKKLADALKVPTSQLLPPIATDAVNPTIKLTFTVELPVPHMTNSVNLQQWMTELMQAAKTLSGGQAVSVQMGSCLVTIRFLQIDALRILALFFAGKLIKSLAISKITAEHPNNFSEDSEERATQRAAKTYIEEHFDKMFPGGLPEIKKADPAKQEDS